MPREIWRPVVGHEGAYEVSNLGRVRSLDRWIWKEGPVRAYWVFVHGKILKPGRCPSGHMTVGIGKRNTQSVHVLVMLAFRGPPPPGHEVLHLNHTPGDNRLSNLKYGTTSENLKMDYVAGTRKGWKNISRWKNRDAKPVV
jgi:hypothetical protein